MSGSTATTLTFVFTDIEGSTRLLRRLGDAYQGVLREHDYIIAAASGEHAVKERGWVEEWAALSTEEAVTLAREVALGDGDEVALGD